MLKTIAPISALLFSVAILLAGNGLQGTLLPIRAQIEAFSAVDIGLLGSSYFAGFVLGCLYAPYAVRRAGHIRSFTAAVCIASSAAIAHSIFPAPGIWWLIRSITGFCFAAAFMVIESWLNELSTSDNRGTIFSAYTIISWTVITAGQQMINLGDPAGFSLFGYASILISLSAVPVALTTSKNPEPIHIVRINLLSLYKNSPIGFTGCMTYGLAIGSFYSLAPVFARQIGMDIPRIALFMSIAVIAGAMGQAPLGLISDRVDRRKIIVFACLLSAVGGTCMAVFGSHPGPAIFMLLVFFGASAFPIYSLSVALANDYASADAYVETASGLLLIYATGAVIGPLAASLLMDLAGARGLFLFTAGSHAVMAIFAIHTMRWRAPAVEEERTRFTEAVLSAHTVAPFDASETARGPQE